MRLRALITAHAFSATLAMAGEGIVSLNVCADQYLLTTRARDHIRSLSYFADDPALSWQAQAAHGLPRNSGHGETLVRHPPAMVIAGRHDPRAKLDMLSQHGVKLAYITPWHGIAHGRDEIRAVTAALGVPLEGEALITRIDAALARAKGAAIRPATVLRLHRRGYVAPGDNLMADIIAATGLIDQGIQSGFQGGVLPVERIIALRPDYLVMNAGSADESDQGAALLAHPALAKLYPPDRRILIPALLSVCEGPSTPDLIDAVADAVRRTVR